MAPARSRKPAKAAIAADPPPRQSDDNVQSQLQDASQSQDVNANFQKLAEVMNRQKEQSKARRKQREQEIEQLHKQRVDQTHRKMKDCRRKHEEDMRELRRPKLDRLRELLAKKRDLESKLAQCHDLKDQAFEATVQRYQAATSDRLRRQDEED